MSISQQGMPGCCQHSKSDRLNAFALLRSVRHITGMSFGAMTIGRSIDIYSSVFIDLLQKVV